MVCHVAGCGVQDAAMREIGSSVMTIDTSFMPFTLEPVLKKSSLPVICLQNRRL